MGIIGTIAYLLGFHYIADYPLQSDYLATTKGKEWYSLLVHCIIYSVFTSLGLWFVNVYTDWKFIVLLVTHIGIDHWKTTKPPENKYLYIDQLLHIIILFILYFIK